MFRIADAEKCLGTCSSFYVEDSGEFCFVKVADPADGKSHAVCFEKNVLNGECAVLDSVKRFTTYAIEAFDIVRCAADNNKNGCLGDPAVVFSACVAHNFFIFLVFNNNKAPVLDVSGGRSVASCI